MLDRTSKSKKKDNDNYLKQITDEQKMKLWIKTLISVQANLPEIINSVDKIIEMNASSLSFATDIFNAEKTTYAQVERVIDLSERKNKLVNIFLISKKLLGCLCEEDRLFLKRKIVFNWTAEELVEEYKISLRTVFRKTEKMLDSIFKVTKQKNWSLNFIKTQVKGEQWLQDRYNKFEKEFCKTKTPDEESFEMELE